MDLVRDGMIIGAKWESSDRCWGGWNWGHNAARRYPWGALLWKSQHLDIPSLLILVHGPLPLMLNFPTEITLSFLLRTFLFVWRPGVLISRLFLLYTSLAPLKRKPFRLSACCATTRSKVEGHIITSMFVPADLAIGQDLCRDGWWFRAESWGSQACLSVSLTVSQVL